MNTVGYGDITPQNDYEKLFCSFFVIVACGFFGYALNQIGSIIQSFSKDDQELSNSLGILNRFINKRPQITFPLKIKLKKYFEFLYKEEKVQNDKEENKMLKELSSDLQDQLLLESNGPILKQFECLVTNFSEQVLRKTVRILQKERYAPGDIIFQQSSISNNSLYYIASGEVQIFIEKNNQTSKLLQSLQQGSVFGEISFFTSKQRELTIKCSKYSRIYHIKQQSFIDLLQDYPTDYQQFCSIKDKLLLYKNYENIPSFYCYSCQKKSFQNQYQGAHSIIECPLMHFVTQKSILIAKHNFSRNQERNKNFKRKRLKKLPHS